MEAINSHSGIQRVLSRFNILSLALRGSSMLGKFLLLMTVSKNGSLQELGVFGLFVSSIMLFNYAQGLEFHAFSARKILVNASIERSTILTNQIIVHLFTYVLVLPMALLMFWGSFLSWEFIGLFYWVVIVTHIGQELQRLLVLISKTTEAYLVGFFVHGVWTYIAIGSVLYTGNQVDLSNIFLFWASSATLGLFLGIWFMKGNNFFGLSFSAIDPPLIREGLNVSYKFFIGVIGYKVIEVSDRYFIQYFHGDAMVGVYTLFSGIANIAHEIVFTGVVVVIFPRMVKAFNENDIEEYLIEKSRMQKDVKLVCICAAVAVLACMFVLLSYLDTSAFRENIPTFFLLLSSVIILNFSLISHYVLYVNRKDKQIMWSVIAAMFVNFTLNFLWIPTHGVFGAAASTTVSFAVIAVIKYRYSARLR